MDQLKNPETIQTDSEEWQVYHPQNQNQSVFKTFNAEIKNLLKLLIFSSTFYLIISLLSPLTIFFICLLLAATFKLVKIKLTQLKKEGLANKLSPKWRQILFEKSIFDIYSDILYFPLITKIIAAFVQPLIAKPHPQQLHQTFESLPVKVQQTIARKGILSLAPQPIKQMIADPQRREILPPVFGVETWEWRNYQIYENHHQKVHEQTMAKNLMLKIDQKVSWKGFMMMASIVGFGVYKMKASRIKKMLIQNGSFVGILMVSIVALIKIKKIMELRKKKKRNEQNFQELRIRILEKDN